MKSRFQPLSDHLQEQNEARVDRLRQKDSGVCVAPDVPTHEQVIAEFEARMAQVEAWKRSVPGGKFCVRYHYRCDRPGMRYVHRSATAEDRERWMRDVLSDMAADVVEVWEDA